MPIGDAKEESLQLDGFWQTWNVDLHLKRHIMDSPDVLPDAEA